MPGGRYGLEYGTLDSVVWLRGCLAGDGHCQPPLGSAPLHEYAGPRLEPRFFNQHQVKHG